MSKSLKEKTISGLVWSTTDRLGQQVVGTIVRIVLARILFPSDFGLVGVLLVFGTFANILQDSGFSTALIRKKTPSQVDYSTVFYFNVLLSIALYLILFFCAPFIANFYEQPLLTNISRVLFFAFVFNAFGIIQNVVIVKSLDFKKSAIISICSSVLSGTVAIGMVVTGFGVWSLVAQVVLSALFRSILLWLLGSFRPLLAFSFKSLKSFFSFSSKMLLTGVMNQSGNIVYTTIIGKYFNMSQVGYYGEAAKYQGITMDTIAGVIGNVSFPVLSSVREHPERMKNIFQKLIRVTAFLACPAMIMLGVVANPLIVVLLTEKWAAAIPMLQILCISGIFYPLIIVNHTLLKTEGKSGLIFKLELTRNIIMVFAIFITLKHGIYSLLWGIIAINILSYFLYSYKTGKLISYSLLYQLKDIAPYLLIALLCILPTLFFQRIVSQTWLQLSLQVAVGGGLYLLCCKLLGSRIIEETQNLLFKKK